VKTCLFLLAPITFITLKSTPRAGR